MSFETTTVLLAEDNPGDVFLIRRALEKHGLKSNLLVMEDGQAALKYLESIDAEDDVVCPDLFLLDMNLPRANGGQILARLRQSARCQETPIVVVTSSDSPADREQARSLGADHYFEKPSDLAGYMELGGIVRKLLESKAVRIA
jgi:CheY-like chemotaxis protein